MSPMARRGQLLGCALRTFARQGIGETSHTDLANEAGVALPTVFHYFSTKTSVVQAALDEVARFLIEEIVEPHREATMPAPLAIETILMTFCDAIDSHPHHIRVWLEWSVSAREGLWDRYLIFYRKALDEIERILARGAQEGSLASNLDLGDAARVVVGLAHMIVQMRFSGSDRKQVVDTVHSLVHGYLERDHNHPGEGREGDTDASGLPRTRP